MDRKDLLQSLKAASHTVSKRETIPIFSCYCFVGGKEIVTSNDVVLSRVRCASGVEGGVRAVNLLPIVENSIASNVELEQKDGNIYIKMGRTKLHLPILGKDSFLFDIPKFKNPQRVPIDAGLIKSMKGALVCALPDLSQPNIAGVSIRLGDDPVLCATDGVSLSRCAIDGAAKGPKVNAVVPKDFCETVIAQWADRSEDDKPNLIIDGSAVCAEFDGVSVYSKLIDVEDRVDFDKIVKAHEDDRKKSKSSYFGIPPALSSALKRALPVADGASQAIELAIANSILRMTTISRWGQITDAFKIAGNIRDCKLVLHLLRLEQVLDGMTSIAITERALLAVDENKTVRLLGSVEN